MEVWVVSLVVVWLGPFAPRFFLVGSEGVEAADDWLDASFGPDDDDFNRADHVVGAAGFEAATGPVVVERDAAGIGRDAVFDF